MGYFGVCSYDGLEPGAGALAPDGWGLFPEVVMYSEERMVKAHPLYSPAKAGDASAAEGLVEDAMARADMTSLQAMCGLSRPFLLAVHALETEGMNVIPRTFARILQDC